MLKHIEKEKEGLGDWNALAVLHLGGGYSPPLSKSRSPLEPSESLQYYNKKF